MAIISEKTKNSRVISLHILTEREIEYLSLIALGCENLEIATKLAVSRSTVKKTLENVFRKLKARNRAHAVSIAFTLGILTTQLLTDANNIFKVNDWIFFDMSDEMEV